MKKILFLFNLLIISTVCFSTNVDISGIDKENLLEALYKNAREGMITQGIFIYHLKDHVLSNKDIEICLKNGYIDHLYGKTMKINISKDYCDTSSYNKYNGINAAEKVIQRFRRSKL